MTKFNPENKETLTDAECLAPAMGITDQDDADQYLKSYIEFIKHVIRDRPGQNPEQIAKINLGYYAGYYDEKVRERVERLFKCQHPIFGSIKEKGSPTVEEALKAGMKAGKRLKKNLKPQRHISNEDQIEMFLHCALCLAEKPPNVTPRDWARVQAGWTKQGLQVWCNRHDCNIIHIDFEGQKHPANHSIPNPSINN